MRKWRRQKNSSRPGALCSRPVAQMEGLLIKGGIDEVDIFLVHFFLGQPQTFANTINMKWITKEPPTLFFNEILTNSQLFCGFIKVPLQL